MKKSIAAFALVLMAFVSVAQQDPQFSQNMFNKLYPNPAFAGSNGAICATAIYRNQWLDFEGAPQTGLISIDAPVEFLHGGLGLTVMLDEIGFENTLNAKLAYALRFDIGNSKLAIGADGGYYQKSIDGNWEPGQVGDPTIPAGSVSNGVFDLGAGIYLNSDKFYLGASALHLNEAEIEFDDQNKTSTNLVRHMYGMAGYSFPLTTQLTLTPSTHIKLDETSTQVDLNMNLLINDRFWVGGSYRLEDAIIAMAGLHLTEKLKLGYSYDITTSDLKTYSSGTHEVMLGYCLNIVKTRSTFMNRNVRFL
ncbi:MAG: type IX secretion system membrane protein PorP/SprF [Bacteroidia bacterium]|nr:type IX secretion system membrane protein PorP/SprF [Bacteroidia bacterium]